MKIVVASTNPVKIEATRLASSATFTNMIVEVFGKAVESGVSEQPRTDSETLTGAFNRVERLKSECSQADYWVGIEGGIDLDQEETIGFGWVVVTNQAGQIGKGRSSAFVIPKHINKLLLAGEELGPAMDQLYKRINIKHAEGAIGILTNGLVTRTDLYYQPLIYAFSQIIN